MVVKGIATYMCVSDSYVREKVTFMEDKVTPTGQETSLKSHQGRVPQIKKLSEDMGCKEIGKTLAIHPDGSVHLCCGHASFDTHGISVGNVSDKTLKQIIIEARKNILFWWVHMYDPFNILNKIDSEYRASTICEACREIFTGSKELVLKYIRANKNELLIKDINSDVMTSIDR